GGHGGEAAAVGDVRAARGEDGRAALLRGGQGHGRLGGQPDRGGEAGRGGGGVRRLRHRGARVPVGRLQGRGREGEGPAGDEQRPVERPGAVRGEDAALVRAVGLQVLPGGEEGRGGGDHHPHRAVRRVPVEGGGQLLGREREVRAARRAGRAQAPGARVGDGGRVARHRQAGRTGPGPAAGGGGEAGLPAGAAGREGVAGVQE